MEELMSKIEQLGILKKEFNKLKGNFDNDTANIQDQIKLLEDEIEEEVLKLQKSLKGQGIDVIYNKGRESWDGKILTGYAVAHPEILAAKKVGQPTVSFRLHKD